MSEVRGWNLPATKATKAWIAGVCAALLSFLTPLALVLVGDATLADISQGQWVVIIIGFLAGGAATGGATYAVSNKPLEK